MSDIRDQIVEYAQSIVGWTAPEDRYLQLVAPVEVANGHIDRAKQVASVSDCALVCHGIRDAVFGTSRSTEYVFQKAPEDLLREPRRNGSYVTDGALPQAGDQLHWAANGAACEHFETVIDITTMASDPPVKGEVATIRVVAGGERNGGGAETIKLIDRNVIYTGSHWTDRHNGRILAGRIDADLFLFGLSS